MFAGNSLVIQCLELGALTAKGPGFAPGRGIKSHKQCSKKKKKKKKNRRKKRNLFVDR